LLLLVAVDTVTGEIAEEPVVNTKTGHVYERRIIERYIETHGVDPITGDPLSKDDLLLVQSGASISKPRAPAATSVPGMLSLFQSEWDSLMLETFELKKHVEQVRQELSHALYQHDAACRVIARLIKERDAARRYVFSPSLPLSSKPLSDVYSARVWGFFWFNVVSTVNLHDLVFLQMETMLEIPLGSQRKQRKSSVEQLKYCGAQGRNEMFLRMQLPQPTCRGSIPMENPLFTRQQSRAWMLQFRNKQLFFRETLQVGWSYLTQNLVL
jgi:hypothetical protein